MTRVATPACEHALLELGRHMTGAQLDRVIRRYQNVSDRDRRRFIEVCRLPSGMVRLVLQIDAEEADALEHTITLAMGPPPRTQADDASGTRGCEEPATGGASSEARVKKPAKGVGMVVNILAQGWVMIVKIPPSGLAHGRDHRHGGPLNESQARDHRVPAVPFLPPSWQIFDSWKNGVMVQI